jgi:hypothetical protein
LSEQRTIGYGPSDGGSVERSRTVLVTARRHGWTLVTQYDHGALAGVLARHWGNERFAAAAPGLREPLAIAAAHHDDGWRELDDLPAYNSEAGRPAHFLEVPLERSVPPYRRGVDSVYARDALAGALADMHWTGLYSARWGLQAGGPVPRPLAAEVVAEREPGWRQALLDAWDFSGPRSEFEADAWHAYEVLQALDLISLAVSLLDPEAPTDPALEALSLPATLGAVEQPPGPRTLPAIPTGRPGEHLDLRLDVTGPAVAALAPWPFAVERFAVELPARRLAAGPLPEDTGGAAYRAAAVEPIAWELVDAEAR